MVELRPRGAEMRLRILALAGITSAAAMISSLVLAQDGGGPYRSVAINDNDVWLVNEPTIKGTTVKTAWILRIYRETNPTLKSDYSLNFERFDCEAGTSQTLEYAEYLIGGTVVSSNTTPVSYTHLTLPTNREV